jgi:hypothetical protein
VIKQARANATATKAASKLSSTTQPTRLSLHDLHSSPTEPEKLISPSTRNHSSSPHYPSVPPQTPTNQQDDSGVTHSRSEEPERISPPDAIGKGREEELGDRQGQPQQEEDMMTPVVVKNSCDTRRWLNAKAAQAPSSAET